MELRPILVVEDNRDDEFLTLRALEKQIHIRNEVVVVRDGVEALTYLENIGKDDGGTVMPALVLLDLKLPKMDGMELLQWIRANERTKTLPVVIFTSSNEEKDLVKSYQLGANSYVRKSIDFVQFSKAVQELGLYWLLLNEPLY